MSKETYYQRNKEKIKARRKEYYHQNKERENTRSLQWYYDHRDEVIATKTDQTTNRKKRYEANKEAYISRASEWRKNHPTQSANSVLKQRYGITLEEWNTMLIETNGLCGICLNPMRNPQLDHCHQTGKVRGLLCPSCNRGIGQFSDNPEILESAIRYLRGLSI